MAVKDWDMKRMGKRIAAWRMTKGDGPNGWSQQELADRAKVSRGSIQAIEAGSSDKDGPGLVTLFRILDALGISAREFFGQPDPEDFDLPFEYDPDYLPFFKLLAEITNSNRVDVQTGILQNLINHADAVQKIDPFMEEQKSIFRAAIQQMLRQINLEGEPPPLPPASDPGKKAG